MATYIYGYICGLTRYIAVFDSYHETDNISVMHFRGYAITFDVHVHIYAASVFTIC